MFPLAAFGCLSCEKECDIHSNFDFVWASDCDFVFIDETQMTNLDGAESIGLVGISMSVTDNAALTDVSGIRDLSAPAGISIERNGALEVISMGPVAGAIFISRNDNVRDIDLITSGGDLFIREASVERVQLSGDSTSLLLRFDGAIPSEAVWDAAALGLTSLSVSGVPDATATSLAPLGIASEFIGVYGSGAMQPETVAVDEYDAALRAAGFTGTLEVCVAVCDSARTPCDDDGRRRRPCDVR